MTRPRVRFLSLAEVEEAERAELVRFEGKEPRFPPPLAPTPSPRTVEATKIVRPWMLYKLLHLESMNVDSVHEQRKQRALHEVERLELERERLLKLSTRLRKAREELLAPVRYKWKGGSTALDESYCTTCNLGAHNCHTTRENVLDLVARLDELVNPNPQQLRMLAQSTNRPDYSLLDDVQVAAELARVADEHSRAAGDPDELQLFADDLDTLAKNARMLADGFPDPELNALVRARAVADRSTWDIRAVTRARAKMLEQKLVGWTREDIAKLIIKSESDWIPAPLKLASTLRVEDQQRPDALVASLYTLIGPRHKESAS